MTLEYTASADCYEQAQLRLRNAKLQKQIDDLLKGQWPPGFETANEPKGIFAPYLQRGSGLEIQALQQAETSGLDPFVATYKNAAYVTANPEIVACYRPPFAFQKGQKQLPWVVDEEHRHGTVGDAMTLYGCDIVAYWNTVHGAVYEHSTISATAADFSAWYDFQARNFGWVPGNSKKAPFYYYALIALYTSGRAVLIDTPPTRFAENIMTPAFEKMRDALGYSAVITCELATVGRRDWINVEFLDDLGIETLLGKGIIE